MIRSSLLCATLLSAVLSTTASAAIVLDGNLDAAYGAPTATVSYNPALSSGNFGTPTQYSDTTPYSIYLHDEGGYYYGFLHATTNTGLQFANLYFDLDPQNNNGSDFGIEVTNSRAFIPGVAGYAAVPGLQFVLSADGLSIEFVVPNSTFTTMLPGLTYYPTPLATNGGNVTLRLSQSFGYTVNGGAIYGNDRLGTEVLVGGAAVPEPETLAILGLGIGALALVRRRKVSA